MIRSGKHDSSTAASHHRDIQRILTDVSSFEQIVHGPAGSAKPVVIITCDGGPDENPRYKKVIENMKELFKDHNLDALFVATNAPGHSAYNRVERRMAPLSRELAGVVLPHDGFGTHLGSQGCCIDSELEKKNFAHAGEVLADIWSAMTVDGHEVTAEYCHPANPEVEPQGERSRDEKWHLKHVQESQYLLQITKCTDPACCSQTRSSLRAVLPDGFLPPPVPVTNTGGLRCTTAKETGARFPPLFLTLSLQRVGDSEKQERGAPYDGHCPSVERALASRVCVKCGKYHGSATSRQAHQRWCARSVQSMPLPKVRPVRVAARRQRELMCIIATQTSASCEWRDEDEVDVTGLDIPPRDPEESALPNANIPEWLQSPWMDE